MAFKSSNSKNSTSKISSFVKSAKKNFKSVGSHGGKNQGDPDPLVYCPPEDLAKIPPEHVARYSDAYLESLPNDRLKWFHRDILARLRPERLEELPGEAIGKLSPDVQLKLSPEALARIPTETLAKVDSNVLLRTLPAITRDRLRNRNLKEAVNQIDPQRLQQLPQNVREYLRISVQAPDQQLPIQRHEDSRYLDKGLPTIPQSTHNFDMPEEYLSSGGHEQQQPGVTSFHAFNPADIDPSAFPSPASRSYSNPPSPTDTFSGGRSSPTAFKSSPHAPASGYHPPKTFDSRPSFGLRRNSSVSRHGGSQAQARSSSRGPRMDREQREYLPYKPDQVSMSSWDTPKVSSLTRDVSEMGLPAPPLRSSSRLDDLTVSDREVIRRAESGTWNDKPASPRDMPRRETPKASRESIINEDYSRSTSPDPSAVSTPSSPELASFPDRMRAAAQSRTTISAKDETDSASTHQVIQDHRIKELKAESERRHKELVNAEAKNIALLERLDKYLDRKKPSEKHKGDAVDVIILYCEEICDTNTKNYEAYLQEKKRREEAEKERDDKSTQLRAAQTNLLGLQTRVNELNTLNAQLQTQESSLRAEIERLAREKTALEERCEKQDRRFETQKLQSDAAIDAIKRHHADELAQLRQTVANHGTQMHSQKEHYEAQLRAEKNKYAEKMQEQRLYYEGEVTRAGETLNEKTQQLQAEIATLHAKHKQDLDQLESASKQALASQQATHDQKLAQQQKAHEDELLLAKKRHTRNVAGLREKVQSLENDLVLGNNDDFRPATDDGLKIQYRQLKLCIDMVTEPINLGISAVPRNLGGKLNLDPTRFLEREGKNQLRFLLRSVVWQKIVEGFFAEPFGFGALGSRGEGREVLRRVVDGWRGLCGYGDGSSLSNGKTCKCTSSLSSS